MNYQKKKKNKSVGENWGCLENINTTTTSTTSTTTTSLSLSITKPSNTSAQHSENEKLNI